MNAFKEKFGLFIKTFAQKFWALSLFKKILIAGAGVTLVLIGTHTEKIEPEQETTTARVVHIASVTDLSRETAPLSLLGTVTSHSEATIRAESGGKIIALYYKLRAYVEAGQTIAQFENSGERAQVLQAEGAYDAARAAKDIAGVNKDSINLSQGEAEVMALNTISSTYATLDDAVRTKTDSAFHNPQSIREVKLVFNSSDSRFASQIEETRSTIETMLRARETRNHALSEKSDLVSELYAVESETRIIKNYLDDLALILSRAIPDQTTPQSTIDGLQSSTALARNTVGSALTGVTQSRNALNNSIAASMIAKKNFDQPNTTSVSDAQVKSALGNLRQAQSRLEKTIIRSPISGTINSLSIKEGDFVSPFSEIAFVSNNNALEVLAYATEEDAEGLAIGNKIKIADNTMGTITSIAPALDPKTKKIEVRIGLHGSTKELTNGQTITIIATRLKTKNTTASSAFEIPLAALKITPTKSIVFTVGTSSTLVAHSVKVGTLQGDKIVITEGLIGDMHIVTDARGLKEGMMVLVK